MKITFTIIVLLFTCGFYQAQPNPYQATAAQTAALKRQAEASAKALTKQDYKQVVYYIYPKVIDAMGGTAKVQERFSGMVLQMQGMGIAIKSVIVGNISPIVQSKGDLYSVVQNVVQMSNNASVITRSSYMLAYSHNNGLRWYFTDSTPLKKQNIKKLFPTYPDGLVIPEVHNPMAGGY